MMKFERAELTSKPRSKFDKVNIAHRAQSTFGASERHKRIVIPNAQLLQRHGEFN